MQMTVEEIYQQIKPLPAQERLRLISKISAELAEENKERLQKRSLLELEGLGAEIWEGIDAQEYVNELRNEWEHRP